MKVLVIGQSGQLGRSIFRHLSGKLDLITFDSRKYNLLHLSEIRQPITDTQPEIIINAAAWTNVDSAETCIQQAREANAFIPRNLAIIASELEIPFFQISTDYVFSGDGPSSWDVDSPTAPNTIYGVTKLEGEQLALNYYKEGTRIFRTAWLYSSFGKNFVKTMLNLAFRNEENIFVVSDQKGQPTSANDLANQIYLSLTSKLNAGIYHATNSGSATWNEFAKEIFNLSGADSSRVLEINSSELHLPAIRPKNSVLSQNCWKSSGISPMRDWREALSEQISEIKESVIRESKL